MKQFFRIACALWFAAAALAACDLNPEMGPGAQTLDLRLVCTDPEVKAPETGEETYFENTLKHIDYFIFAQTTGMNLLHNRVDNPGASCEIPLRELVDSGSLVEGETFYVYVVANWPESFTTAFTDTVTVAGIQGLEVTSTDLDVTASTPQTHRFVMDTRGLVPATLTSEGATATAGLDRLAAKMSMQVKIPDHILSGSVTYTPDLNSLQVYYLYATMKGTLDGTPMSYDASTEASYFNYPARNVSVPSTQVDGKYTATAPPFYTYPEKWESHETSAPYFKVVLSWSNGTIVKPYYYKVLLPESLGEKIDRNSIYKFVMNIGVLGSETDEGAVEIDGSYYVENWKTGVGIGYSGIISRGKYLDIASDTYYIYGGNSIEIPVTSSHNIEVTVNSATYTSFSGQDPAPASLPSTAYSVTTDGRLSFTLTHTLVTDITSANLDCSAYEFTLTVSNGVSPSKQVRIVQFPPVYISSERSNGYVFINGRNNQFTDEEYKSVYDDGEATYTRTYTPTFNRNVSSNSVTYTDSQGGATIVFDDVEGAGNGNNRRYTMGRREFDIWSLSYTYYDGTITVNAPAGGLISEITIGYYGNQNSQNVSYSVAGTSSSKTSWVGSASQVIVTMSNPNNNNRNVVNYISVKYSYSQNAESLGSIDKYVDMSGGGTNQNPNIYTVSASSLAGTDWIIADPRSQVVDFPTLRGGSATGSLTGYMAAGTEYADAVAPVFKVASSHGINRVWLDFVSASKRCASYQENGYPAGRWRVPTDAEIRFIAYLSANGKLPSLFEGFYLTASGVVLHVSGSTVAVTDRNTGSVRCVYDAWYWGTERVEDYLQVWSGWQNNI